MVTRYLITSQEREFFANWLEHEVLVGEYLIEDLLDKNGPGEIIRRAQAEVNAERLIAAKLRAM